MTSAEVVGNVFLVHSGVQHLSKMFDEADTGIQQAQTTMQRRSKEIQELERRIANAKGLSDSDSGARLGEKLQTAQQELAFARQSLSDYQFDKEQIQEDIKRMKAQEDEWYNDVRRIVGSAATTFRTSTQKAVSDLVDIRALTLFSHNQTTTEDKVMPYGAWEKEQSNVRNRAREQLQELHRSIITACNANTAYASDTDSWTQFVVGVDLQLQRCLLEPITRALKSLLRAVSGMGVAPMFSVALKLGSNCRLQFLPLVTDIPQFLSAVVNSIVSISNVPYAHQSVNQPVNADIVSRFFPKSLQETIADHPEVVQLRNAIADKITKLPDLIVEYICSVEDTYQTLWMPDMVKMSLIKLTLSLAQVEYQFEPLYSIDSILLVDGSQLQSALMGLLTAQISKLKDQQSTSHVDQPALDPHFLAVYQERVARMAMPVTATPIALASSMGSNSGRNSKNSTPRNQAAVASTPRTEELPPSTKHSSRTSAVAADQQPAAANNTAPRTPTAPAAPASKEDVKRLRKNTPPPQAVPVAVPVQRSVRPSAEVEREDQTVQRRKDVWSSPAKDDPSPRQVMEPAVAAVSPTTSNPSASTPTDRAAPRRIDNNTEAQQRLDAITKQREDDRRREELRREDDTKKREEQRKVDEQRQADERKRLEEQRKRAEQQRIDDEKKEKELEQRLLEMELKRKMEQQRLQEEHRTQEERSRKLEEDLLRRRLLLGSPDLTPAIPQEKSLLDEYRTYCAEFNIKPNSGLLKLLPKEPGRHVSEINLDLNYIGIKGIQPLLQILKRNRGLRLLNLKDNNLENNEVRSLVSVLLTESGAELEVLDLSNNPISLAGGSALMDLATKQKTLRAINLRGTLIQPKVIDKIAEVVQANNK